jgi:hypothetical protein
MKRRFALFSCAIALFAAASSGPAVAGTDHLKCYKIKDVGAFKSATADLLPSSLQFVGENCSLKGKAAQLCVPAEKRNVVIEDGTGLNISGDALTGAQLCYKVKCPSTATENVQVNDQFGTRQIEKGKATKVCGPVIEQ